MKTGAPLRSFSRFLASHLESIPARGTDAEGKAALPDYTYEKLNELFMRCVDQRELEKR